MSRRSQLQAAALRARIRKRIDRGELPVLRADYRISAGYGSGLNCLACGKPITRSQVEYEVEDPKDAALLGFHFGCHVLWQLECDEQLLKPKSR
jgi:hypothetical protein